ncbi:Collectin-12 [Holothuria leucospilota]|uniref:Collectin-12 n=1 Tax=Holothuria leucospilota TaxID=206669 RepID=A0A9Q1C7G3_HOLLE|nr:Collectin-12 [Holothuria leucospilota]
MASKQKRVILVLTLLAFSELIKSMGFGKFNKMFPLREEEKKCFRRAKNEKGMQQWHRWNQSSYTFVHTKSTWEDAANACSAMSEGAHLVFIESEPENREVSRLAKAASEGKEERWWIGLTDKVTEGSWKWYNVSLFYTSWGDGEPNNFHEDCGELGYWWNNDFALWNNEPCTRQKKFICEKDSETSLN